MKPIYHYSTVVEALEDLSKIGFTYDFNLHNQEISSNPNHYKIMHIYRYDGFTDPDEEATVYGIESIFGKKGVFVTGFSANSMDEAAKILNDLSIKS
jgi:hypothetical protein